MDLAHALPPPPWLWGVFTRALSLAYLASFASLARQLPALAGSRGISPVVPLLARIRTDFPAPARFFHFPTVLWISASDRALRILPLLGCIAALIAFVGGAASPFALAACWLLDLSLDLAADYERPWDTLLLEAGLLALFLPALRPLPEMAATAAPVAAIGWAYRWLFFRVMLGFGKQKFSRSTLGDLDYLKCFFINQPMPTPLGYFAHRLPLWILKPALALTFFIEVLLPFGVFSKGWPRLLAGALTGALMVAIQLAGNYSFFNLLVLGLCVTLFDVNASVFDAVPFVSASGFERIADLFALVVAVGGLVHLPFNHWCTRTFLHWPRQRALKSRPVAWLLGFYRALAPFHVVHAYGVFPPRTGPPLRVVPRIEGTRDGVTWEPYRWRDQPCTEDGAPRFLAPLHPWVDFTLVYEGMGHNLSGYVSTISGVGNPYRFSRHSRFDRLMERLLEGSPEVTALFDDAPFTADAPPVAVRARLCLLAPARGKGRWWTLRILGTHAPATERRPSLWQTWLPTPELFHEDDVFWRARAPSLRGVLDATADDPRAALRGADDLDEGCLDTLWREVIPTLGRPSLGRVPEVLKALEARFDVAALRRIERVRARLAALLQARLEPYHHGERAPSLGLRSHFELALLSYYVIGQGREVYASVLAEPAKVTGHLDAFTPEAGLFHLALFRPETLRYHAMKLRLAARTWGEKLLDSPLRGFPDLYPLLAEHFKEPDEDAMPQMRRIVDGWQEDTSATEARS